MISFGLLEPWLETKRPGCFFVRFLFELYQAICSMSIESLSLLKVGRQQSLMNLLETMAVLKML